MAAKHNLLKVFSLLAILAMMFSPLQRPVVSAQGGDGIRRQINTETGRVHFLGPESGRSLSAARALGTSVRPQDPAMALAERFAPEFGLKDPGHELALMKKNASADGRLMARYQQQYRGIPVLGGELIVNTNQQGDLYSINGEVSASPSLETQPAIDGEQARQIALQALAKWYQKTPDEFESTQPELWIFDEGLLQRSTKPVELVWRMDVTPKDAGMPVRELVLVNAQRGSISLHYNQVDTEWSPAEPVSQPLSLDPQIAPSAAATIIRYDDLAVDQARNRLYGADKVGNKVDVINIADLSVVSSFSLVYGSAPIGLDLSPDGNELAIAQSGIGFVKFVNLTDNTMSETPAALSGPSTKITDVLYGRTGILYALTDKGLHVINLNVSPHAEDPTQYVAGDGSYDYRSGALSSDRNTLYYVTGTCCSGYNSLEKYNVSAGLTKPTLLKRTHLYGTGYMTGLRLSMLDDANVVVTTGSVYNTSALTPKAKNFQTRMPAISLAGKGFYVTLYDNASGADTLNFWDNASSYKRSYLSTGVVGTAGAIVASADGSTLFVSSTGGMAKFTIGGTPPGTAVGLPASQHHYKDLAIDLPRGQVYGTDISGRLDVISMDTTAVVNSYLLPSGANPIGVDLSPDGSELAIALNGLEKIVFLNPETGATIAEVTPQLDDSIYYTNLPFDVIYGRSGRLYSDGNPDSGGIDYLHIIDTATHTWVGKSPYPLTLRTGSELMLRSDHKYLYANQTFSPNNIYIYDVQTDTIAQLYQGPHGPVAANKFTMVPDGSKIFTSNGQVWDSIMQSQLGTLEGAPGSLIEYVPNKNVVVFSATVASGQVLKFVNATDYHLIGTYSPSPAGPIHEMEVSADGNKLVLNINSQIQVLSLDANSPSAVLVESGSNQTVPPLTPLPLPLKAKVTNIFGEPISGITVTFTAPASGASGKFSNTNSNVTTAITDGNGIATASTFTSNNLNGAYVVNATIAGVNGPAAFQLSNGVPFRTYTAGGSTNLPGSLVCNEIDPTCAAGDAHARAAHKYAIGTYTLYASKHLRNSINNQGMAIISTVHYGYQFDNAFWDGTQMVYGDKYGFALADDVVAHELSHGVTQYESNLFYYYQSGAINESLSDLWGEYYDQTDGQGNDAQNVKWLVGEDVTGLGALRSMSNPPAYGDPDKMSSTYYYEGAGDSGGVHFNSGVNNKAVYLMVDGGTFNGKAVTALGWDKTAAIYYEANTELLTSGADYSDLYYALQQACTNLIGEKGITSGDCTEVTDALDAVEMNGQPAPNYNTDAPLCPAYTPNYLFTDDLETGTGKWTFNNGNTLRWQYDSPYGPYAQSGSHFLYADDWPQSGSQYTTDATAKLTPFAVPNNAYLHFAQAYDFEYDSYGYWDGGVLEYTTNGGSTWVDAGPLMEFNGYRGTIFNSVYNDNPLRGRSAFIGSSHGYISTRVNLASLASKTVSFRWRMGLDGYVYSWGWWVDNVKMYTCGPSTIFADVPNTHWAWTYIETLYNAGITGGCTTGSPLNYCPSSTVNRAQMAVFLLRGIHGSSYVPPDVNGDSGFLDVAATSSSAPWIKELAAEGITGGCGNGNYCPTAPVSRAQMAIFLLRAKYGSSYIPPDVNGDSGFADVPADSPTAPWIKQLVAEGITAGCGGGNFCPSRSVTRDQMAIFLVRTFSLP